MPIIPDQTVRFRQDWSGKFGFSHTRPGQCLYRLILSFLYDDWDLEVSNWGGIWWGIPCQRRVAQLLFGCHGQCNCSEDFQKIIWVSSPATNSQHQDPWLWLPIRSKGQISPIRTSNGSATESGQLGWPVPPWNITHDAMFGKVGWRSGNGVI